MQGITAKGKRGHGLVQLTAQFGSVRNYKGQSVGRDKAREIHSSLCNKALEYLTKEFTFYPKRASEMFKD